MIISHTHKFIFVHCRKVAGSSVKLKLAPLLGAEDLIIGSADEIQQAGVPLTRAMNLALKQPVARLYYWAGRALGVSSARATNIALKRAFIKDLGDNPPHPTALRIAAFVGHNWNTYTKFCFTRNPYERVVSDYLWRRRTTGRTFSFAQYLEALKNGDDTQGLIQAQATSNWEMMTIDDQMQMDFVGRYERLQNDFQQITERLGLGRQTLDVASKNFGKKSDYGTLYGPKERKIVDALFEKEIDHFSYEFPF